MASTLTPRVLHGDNPFDVDPALELLPRPRHDVPNWSENAFFFVWDPAESVGVFIHTGRCPDDIELWWAQTYAYLPGGEVLADRSWGRPTDDRGPRTGNLAVRCEEPLRRWTLSFDGAGERTSTEEMSRRVVGAGPAVPLRFDIECRALGPVWDMLAAIGVADAPFGSRHHEQTFTATGTMTAGGRTWELDGVACRDRSVGPRDVTPIGGDAFFHLVFPMSGRSVQGLIVWNREGEVQMRSLSIHEAGRLEILSDGSITGAADPAGAPHELELRMCRVDGEELVLSGRQLHGATMSILDPNTNVNGTPEDGDPLVFSEAAVSFTWPDGEIGYGHLERGCRLTGFPAPAPR